MSSRNVVVLDATVLKIEPLRYTPAGVPVVRLKLRHESEQSEAGSVRKVECEIEAVAIGDVANEIGTLEAGVEIAVKGFLSRRGHYSDFPVLHINQIRLTKEVHHATPSS